MEVPKGHWRKPCQDVGGENLDITLAAVDPFVGRETFNFSKLGALSGGWFFLLASSSTIQTGVFGLVLKREVKKNTEILKQRSKQQLGGGWKLKSVYSFFVFVKRGEVKEKARHTRLLVPCLVSPRQSELRAAEVWRGVGARQARAGGVSGGTEKGGMECRGEVLAFSGCWSFFFLGGGDVIQLFTYIYIYICMYGGAGGDSL